MQLINGILYVEDYITRNRVIQNKIVKEDIRNIITDLEFTHAILDQEGISPDTPINFGVYADCIDLMSYERFKDNISKLSPNYIGDCNMCKSLLDYNINLHLFTIPILTSPEVIDYLNEVAGQPDSPAFEVSTFTEKVGNEIKEVEDLYLPHLISKAFKTISTYTKQIESYITSHFDGDEAAYERWLQCDTTLYIKFILYDGCPDYYNNAHIKNYIPVSLYIYIAEILSRLKRKGICNPGAVHVDSDTGNLFVLDWLFDHYFNKIHKYLKLTAGSNLTPQMKNEAIINAFDLHKGDYCLFSLCSAKDLFLDVREAEHDHFTYHNGKCLATKIPTFTIGSQAFFVGHIVELNNSTSTTEGSITIAFYNYSCDVGANVNTTSVVTLTLKTLKSALVTNVNDLVFKEKNFPAIRGENGNSVPIHVAYVNYLISHLGNEPLIIPMTEAMVFEHACAPIYLPELPNQSTLPSFNYLVKGSYNGQSYEYTFEDLSARKQAMFKAFVKFEKSYAGILDYEEFKSSIEYCEVC